MINAHTICLVFVSALNAKSPKYIVNEVNKGIRFARKAVRDNTVCHVDTAMKNAANNAMLVARRFSSSDSALSKKSLRVTRKQPMTESNPTNAETMWCCHGPLPKASTLPHNI